MRIQAGEGKVPQMFRDRRSIVPCQLPASALLSRYLRPGAYADCYMTRLPLPIALPEYVEGFYTTAVFKLERRLLQWLAARPSSDLEVRRLARGESDAFAAWNVEARMPDQLLLCDFQRRTRSWLMVAPAGSGTFLYFGSAVTPARARSGEQSLGFAFHALLVFHKLYSRVLLASACSRLAGGR